ncbi:MAG: TRAP transporter large permease [Candidatus Rokubacteria bacterium]|nr:TRAP transporter large permease [Candidatus Rokubacteria bacterium]
MSELLVAAVGFAVLFALILARVPIAAAMALVGVGGTAWLSGWSVALATLRQGPFERASSYTLVVIPLFVMMGYLSARAGLSQNLFRAANTWLGHRRGGLAMATVAGCAGFGAICGSSVATGATMCSVALPEMRRYRYADSLSTGAIAAGGTLGIMVPPSIIFVIYGIMTEQSIGKLLLSGVVPGLIETGLFMLAIAAVTAWRPHLGAPAPAASWRDRVLALRDVWEVMVLFAIVVGGIYGGIATPAESAAFGAVGALVFGLVKRRLGWGSLLGALDETVRTTAMVFFIVIGADLFGYFMALSQMPIRLAAWLTDLQVAPVVVLWAIILTYIALGALMDELAMILLTVPIFFPVVKAVGYDPIWFGVIIVVVVQIGLIAPPVGLNVFVIGGMARDVPLATIYRGVMPFLAAMIVLLVMLTVWPEIALVLPNRMK